MSDLLAFTPASSIRLTALDEDDLPLTVDAKGLAKLLSSSVRSIRTWDASGKLPKPLRIGGRVLRSVADLRARIDAGSPDRQAWEVLKTMTR